MVCNRPVRTFACSVGLPESRHSGMASAYAAAAAVLGIRLSLKCWHGNHLYLGSVSAQS